MLRWSAAADGAPCSIMFDGVPPLPNYSAPPVVEVVLAVQFQPLMGLRTARLGLLWERFRERFPLIDEQFALPRIDETFPPYRGAPFSVQFESADRPPPARMLLMNEARTEMLQIQQDRFVHNWRKMGDEAAYPRYEHLRQTFVTELEQFRAFVGEQGIGEIVPDLAEVVYVNHVRAGQGWSRHGEIDRVVRLWQNPANTPLPEPELVRFATQYLLPGDDGAPVGRLYVVAEPALAVPDGPPMIILTLTARALPTEPSIGAVMQLLDRQREWIVRTFDAIVTPEMQRVWGRHAGDSS